MAIDPELLTKAAKVYEAAESVEGMKPKEVYESHKKCAPGEFNMHKEGTAQLQRAVTKLARQQLAATPMMPERSMSANVQRKINEYKAPGGHQFQQAANRKMLTAGLNVAGKFLGGNLGRTIGNAVGTGIDIYGARQNELLNNEELNSAVRADAGARPPTPSGLRSPAIFSHPVPTLPHAAPRPPVSMPPRGIGSAVGRR